MLSDWSSDDSLLYAHPRVDYWQCITFRSDYLDSTLLGYLEIGTFSGAHQFTFGCAITHDEMKF
jgi:hypothetical protein